MMMTKTRINLDHGVELLNEKDDVAEIDLDCRRKILFDIVKIFP
jgi:hypothetical protein